MTRADGAQAAQRIIREHGIHKARETYYRFARDDDNPAEYWREFWKVVMETEQNDRLCKKYEGNT